MRVRRRPLPSPPHQAHLTSHRHEQQVLHSERSEFMLFPVERTLRRRAPTGALASVRDDSEGGGRVWSVSSAVFLTRTMVRAAPQSTKAKVAPFHNFILERGGALKPCRDKETVSQEKRPLPRRWSRETRRPPLFHHNPDLQLFLVCFSPHLQSEWVHGSC